jgi:hypothetical protein
MCLYAHAEGVLEICSATLVLHLDLDGLGKHHEHFGACNLGGWGVDGMLQKELGHASPNRLRRFLCLSLCLCDTCRNRTHLRSKIVKLHTEVQNGAVLHGMPKSPASVTSPLLSDTLDAVDVLLASTTCRAANQDSRTSSTVSAQPSPTRRSPQPQPESPHQQQQLTVELTFGHCSDQPRQSSGFASTTESMMSADTLACSIFVSLCSHHTFPQAYPAFGRWKWFLRMYFVHFVFLHINIVRCWLLAG